MASDSSHSENDSENDSKEWSQLKLAVDGVGVPKVIPSISSTTGKVVNNPLKHSVNIEVASVAYLKSDETPDTAYCAILLKLTFRVKDVLERADIPLNVKLTTTSRSATSKKVQKQRKFWASSKSSKQREAEEESFLFDVPFLFPNEEERVSTGSYTITQTMDMKPDISVSVAGSSGHLGGVGPTKKTEGIEDKLLMRCGMKRPVEKSLISLNWSFQNQGSSYYPASHSLIILVSLDPRTKPPPFTFKLIILKSLKVTTQSIWSPHASGDWEFQIRGKYYPKKVDDMLRAYKEKTRAYHDITLVNLASIGHTGTASRGP